MTTHAEAVRLIASARTPADLFGGDGSDGTRTTTGWRGSSTPTPVGRATPSTG